MKCVPLKTCQCLLMLVSHQVHQRLSVHQPRTIGTHLILTTLHAHTCQLVLLILLTCILLTSPLLCHVLPSLQVVHGHQLLRHSCLTDHILRAY